MAPKRTGTNVRRRALIAIIPGVAAAAAALGFAVSTATASTGHPASHSASHSASRPASAGRHRAATTRPAGVPKAYNCLHAQVRPASFTLACADGNSYLAHLSWSSWTANSARGTGTQMINDCRPYCAAGKFRGYPADVTFWRSEPVPNHPGQRYFSRVTLRYPGARPPVSSGGKQVNGPATWTGALSTQLTLPPAQPN
jgi:hypothetical protein